MDPSSPPLAPSLLSPARSSDGSPAPSRLPRVTSCIHRPCSARSGLGTCALTARLLHRKFPGSSFSQST